MSARTDHPGSHRQAEVVDCDHPFRTVQPVLAVLLMKRRPRPPTFGHLTVDHHHRRFRPPAVLTSHTPAQHIHRLLPHAAVPPPGERLFGSCSTTRTLRADTATDTRCAPDTGSHPQRGADPPWVAAHVIHRHRAPVRADATACRSGLSGMPHTFIGGSTATLTNNCPQGLTHVCAAGGTSELGDSWLTQPLFTHPRHVSKCVHAIVEILRFNNGAIVQRWRMCREIEVTFARSKRFMREPTGLTNRWCH